eukprot:TRINITY_DN27711_c0_g1_i1.p1 TRINITY_DN27711_c0_g1~~TRINITY_DN27711_c0_g1_i1.p1  ORF type:complete len:106 (+),score=27.87 TRINITY_DN27711_c0_g1_i1:137-454(+)
MCIRDRTLCNPASHVLLHLLAFGDILVCGAGNIDCSRLQNLTISSYLLIDVFGFNDWFHHSLLDRSIFCDGNLTIGCLGHWNRTCLLYTSPSPRDRTRSRMPSSA